MSFHIAKLLELHVTKTIEVEEPSGNIRLISISLTRDSAPGLFAFLDFLSEKYGPDPVTGVLSTSTADDFSLFLKALNWEKARMICALDQVGQFIDWMVEMEYLIEERGADTRVRFTELMTQVELEF